MRRECKLKILVKSFESNQRNAVCVRARAFRQQIFINIPLFTFIDALLSLKYYSPDTRSSVNRTWIYCICICKLLMFRCFRSAQMLHNVKENNIDLFEEHVPSFQIHEQVQLQINLKCTDARPQIIWSYMRTLSEHQTIERKDRLH